MAVASSGSCSNRVYETGAVPHSNHATLPFSRFVSCGFRDLADEDSRELLESIRVSDRDADESSHSTNSPM